MIALLVSLFATFLGTGSGAVSGAHAVPLTVPAAQVRTKAGSAPHTAHPLAG